MKQKPLKICLISNEFPSKKTTGGIGTYTYNLAKGLGGNGHKVYVITENSPDLLPDGYKLIILGKPGWKWLVIRKMLGFLKLGRSFDCLWFSLRAYLEAARLNKQYKLDVIEGPEWQGQLFFISLLLKVPTVIRLHTCTKKILELEGIKENPDYQIINFLEKFSTKKSKVILAASYLIKNDSVKDLGLNPAKIRILSLPIDARLFKGKAVRQTSPLILFTGRFEVKKGILDLFKTIPGVKKVFPNVVYKFTGLDRPYLRTRTMKQYLLEMATKQDLLQNIEFSENVFYPKLRKQYLSASAFVNPSRYESFGMTVLEALIANTPVIIYKSLGISEMVSKYNLGTVVRNKKNLTQSIINCLKSKPQTNTYGFVKKNLNLKKIAVETVKIYQTVI